MALFLIVRKEFLFSERMSEEDSSGEMARPEGARKILRFFETDLNQFVYFARHLTQQI